MKKIFRVFLLSLASVFLLTAFGSKDAPSILGMLGSCIMRASAMDGAQVSIIYGGKLLEFSQPNSVVRKDGYFLAPAEELASQTGWKTELYKNDSGSDCIRFTNEVLDLKAEACIGQNKISVNGSERTISASPEVINGVVMFPVKDFFYAINCSVKWVESSGTVIVSEPLARVFSDKDVIVHKAQAAPVIDGKADDAAWAGAEENGSFTTVYYNEKPRVDTNFKVTYDDNAIYFFINCEGKPVALEGISLVLAPSDTIGSTTPFFNAVLIPEPGNTSVNGTDRTGGLKVRYRLDTQENDIYQDNDFDAKYVINDTSWTAEVKIPYNKLVTSSDSIAPIPTNAAEWRFNVSRVRPFTESASSWVPIRNSVYSDDMLVGDKSYTVIFGYAPATSRTGSIFFEGYPETNVFDGTQMPYISVVPQNAGLRYMGYDTKLVFFDKKEDLNIKKLKFSAEWIDQLGVKSKAEILKITEKDSKLYFTVKHPTMSNDGLYRLNIYIDKDNDKGNGNGYGKIIGAGNMVQKYEMIFDRQQVMDAGIIFNSFAVNTAASNKTILPNKNLKESEQSDTVKNLIKIIPETMGFTLNGSPVSGSFKYDAVNNRLTVVDSKTGAVNLTVTKTKNDDGTVTYTTTPETYKDNGCLTVTSKTGKQVNFNYYEDANGNRYFLDEQLNRYAKDYINGQIYTLAKNDPLGAAYVLYEVAKAYQDWVPMYDYYNNAYPIQPSWGPPYGYFGGILSRWNFEELFGIKNYCDAYAVIKGTNALDIVSDQVGENAEELLVDGMLKGEVEYKSTFPNYSMNMDYKSWQGLVSLSKATGDPDYAHQAINLIDEYVKKGILLDGFWKEVTLSYHTQSISGLIDTIGSGYLKRWSDPAGYISPRTGMNVQNLDMNPWYPVLKTSSLLANTVVYPDKRYYPIQDTWVTGTTSSSSPNLGSILLPAANIARMSKGTGTDASQLYMTYAPQYGSHYHYDPLSLSLYSNGQALLPDLGYTHSQLKPWAVSTMGHNTVVVDSKDAIQPASASYGGKVENYADIDSTVQIMKANEENAYPGIKEYDREPWYIKMEGSNDSYVLDIFRVDGGSRHEYTLNGSATSETVTFTPNVAMTPYNQDSNPANNDAGRLLPEGTVVTLPTSETDPGKAVYNGKEQYYGYISVENVQKADLADGKYEITVATSDGSGTKLVKKAGMKITGFAGANSELFIGKVPSLKDVGTGTTPAAVNYTPKMVVRREGTDLQSTFVNVMEPYAADSSSKITSIEKFETANPKDVAMKIKYGNYTDVIISSSDPSTPLTVGDITLTGKMAFIRYLGNAVAKVYTVGTESVVVNGENIAGGGNLTGKVVSTMRTAAGNNMNAFVVDTAVTDAAVGKTITITHPDGSVHAFEVASVTPQAGNTIVEIKDMDPGFEILDDGSSEMCYYPLTKWTGDHTFNIAMDTVTDYGLIAQRTKQRTTYYTAQERLNARDNISKGYSWAVAARDSAVALADTYTAMTNDELWNMVAQQSINADMDKALQALSEAYIYTGDVKYARTGLILLDRIADIYPDMQITGSISEFSLEQTLIKAYDAFYPAVDDIDLITFLSGKAEQYKLHNPKITGDLICKNIEDRILRQVRSLASDLKSMDSFGMQQAAFTHAAVVLDNPPETTEWLDFVFKAGGLDNGKVTGGNILPLLVSNTDRDGMGNETSPSYNWRWVDSLGQIADALDGYDKYTKVDLYKNPMFLNMLTAYYPLSAAGKYTVQKGDSDETGVPWTIGGLDNVIKGFKKTGDPVLAQLIYYLNNHKLSGLHASIFAQNPEGIKDDIAEIIQTKGELSSTTMAGYGFSILRDGSAPYKELCSITSFNNMTKDSSNSNTTTKYFDTNGVTQLEATAPGLSVSYQFQIPNDGIYRIDITPFKAGSYGTYDILVDGLKQLSYDFYGSTGANSGVLNIMTDTFKAGTHTIKFVCTGKNASATNYKMGVISFIATQIITQDGTQRDFWMYYGQTRPSYSHKDQLNFGVHAYGLDMAPDLGTPDTGDQTNSDWVSSTLSHNTVVVDNSSQQPVVDGNPLHFDNSGTVQVMDAESNNAYQQTQLYRRSVVMVKVSDDISYGVDFFRVKGGNDHTYSFHSTAGTVSADGLNLTAQPASGNLDNIRKDAAPASNFSIDYDIVDRLNVLANPADLHLRLTMLGEYNDVSVATGYAPGNMQSLEYILAHRTGSNLESVFTSVIEPYKDSRYIQSIEEAVVTKDGNPVSDMEARAVKVTLTNGRIDYIISALNNANTYNIDGKFNFKGIEGVCSEMNGTVITSYVNDGTVIGDKLYDTAAVTGTVTGFTRELSNQNQLSVTFDNPYDASKLVGRYIYIKNDDVQNGTYQIKGVVSQNGNDVTFDLGTVSVIRSYIDSNDPSKGFVYNIAEGNLFNIPIGNITAGQ